MLDPHYSSMNDRVDNTRPECLNLPHKTGELDAAKNEIDSVRKFYLSQSKHLTSQYNVAVHSVQNEKTTHVERAPLENIGLKLLFLSQLPIQFVKLLLVELDNSKAYLSNGLLFEQWYV
jgi:hypothetical protein